MFHECVRVILVLVGVYGLVSVVVSPQFIIYSMRSLLSSVAWSVICPSVSFGSCVGAFIEVMMGGEFGLMMSMLNESELDEPPLSITVSLMV